MELLKKTQIEYSVKKEELQELLLEQLKKEGHTDKDKISFSWVVEREYHGYQDQHGTSVFKDVKITIKP